MYNMLTVWYHGHVVLNGSAPYFAEFGWSVHISGEVDWKVSQNASIQTSLQATFPK